MKINKLKVEDLRAKCISLGLPSDGNKRELLGRLEAQSVSQNEESSLFGTNVIEGSNKKSSIIERNSFYIQMNIGNLPIYLSKGVLYPNCFEDNEVYIKENRKQDNLSLFPNYLVLSKHAINDFDETQVLVEVVLNNQENSRLLENTNLFFLSQPLPVSRIRYVHFFNNSVRNSFLASLNSFPDSYLPESVTSIISDKLDSISLLDVQYGNEVSERDIEQWKGVLLKFDKILGSIAFLKNASLLYSNITNEFNEYSPGYFDVLSLINTYESESKKINVFFKWILFPSEIEVEGNINRFIFKSIIEGIYANFVFDIDWAVALIDECVKLEKTIEKRDELKKIAILFNQYKKFSIDYKSLIANKAIQSSLPVTILVFLIKFSNKSLGHTDKQAVRNYFSGVDNSIEKVNAEFILAVLGLYYGYRNLVKTDVLNFRNEFYKSLGKNRENIKFQLNSYFDRFAIESVFEFCKKGCARLNNSFDFLVFSDKAKLEMDNHIKSDVLNFNNDGKYVDKSVIKFNKYLPIYKHLDPFESVCSLIDGFYPKNISQQYHLFAFVFNNFPELINIDKDKLIEKLRDSSKFNLDELVAVAEVDKKIKNIRNK